MTALAVRLVAGLTLMLIVGVGLLPMMTVPPPDIPRWLVLPGGVQWSLLLLAPAAVLVSSGLLAIARVLAAMSLALAALMLFAWLATAVGAVSEGWQSLRPTLLSTIGIAALAASLCWRQAQAKALDASALLGSCAVGIFFLIATGHWYGAELLTADPWGAGGRSSGLAATLLLAVALASLATHPAGPLALYRGKDAGAVAKRRLLPAAILTPVASGFVLLYALTGQQLSPPLAVALTVFVNVLVMLLLIDGAGNQVTRVAQAEQQRMEAREAAAKKQGMRDAMTGLLNRRGWDQALRDAERRCKSEKLDACIVIIDLDGLKRINDSQGHKAGDALIQGAGAALRKAARRGDALARLGGDEFACLTVGCDEGTASAIVTRFEQALANAQVAASVGYSMRANRSLPKAFEAADEAMYQQKRARKLKRA